MTRKPRSSPPRAPAPEPDDAPDNIRLQRYLAMAGVGSRRHCEEYISTGRVTVDGQTVTELGARIDPNCQKVRLDGEKVVAERKVYYLLNKPQGYLCTNADPAGRARAVDLIPRPNQRLFSVGRLDEHSQGLLIVTNDGELANRLAHPRFRVPKVYRVQVAGIPTPEVIAELERGMYFAEGKFQVRNARRLKLQGKSAVLEMVLTEGQNREIRRLLARIGHKVLKLERVALGPIALGDLPVGEFRSLSSAEVRALQDLVADNRPATKSKSPRRPGAARSSRATPGGRRTGSPRSAAGGRTPATEARPGKRVAGKRVATKRVAGKGAAVKSAAGKRPATGRPPAKRTSAARRRSAPRD